MATDAVNTFFDRLNAYFPPPVFVGRRQPLLTSIIASAIMLWVSYHPLKGMRDEARERQDRAQEAYAIALGFAVLFLVMHLQGQIADRLYVMAMYKNNLQHFANTHWVREYSKASRTRVL